MITEPCTCHCLICDHAPPEYLAVYIPDIGESEYHYALCHVCFELPQKEEIAEYVIAIRQMAARN